MMDLSIPEQLPGILQNGAGANRLPVRQGIHIVDHPDLGVIRAQRLQLAFKALLHFPDIAGSLILAMFPDRAQMRLQNKSIPPPLQSSSQIRPEGRIGRIQVYEVCPRLLHDVHILTYLFIGAV